MESTKTVQLEVVMPEGSIHQGPATMVVIPSMAGDMGALPLHNPLLAQLRPGVVEAHLPGGQVKKFYVSGGIAEVLEERVSILSQEAIAEDLLDLEKLHAKQADLEAMIEVSEKPSEHLKAELERLKAFIDFLGKK